MLEAPARSTPSRLLHTRYQRLASNTIDYWMLPEDASMTEARILRAIESAPVLEGATLQLYLHVPFCAQHCAFCAFSGGNSLDFKQAERYSRLVVLQMRDLMGRVQARGTAIRSVNIGGGAPELLGKEIGHVLAEVRDLPGCGQDTEISVELTLSTCKPEFIEELVRHEVTKVSFGIQSFDGRVRTLMGQPTAVRQLDAVLSWIGGRIPVVNADLMTGLPGQTLQTVMADLQRLREDPRVNCISSYLLTTGAAPALLHGIRSGAIPEPPAPSAQALMRLHTYAAFQREGWVRRGTNTYVHPGRVAPEALERIAGNECIGASHYEAFLLGAGPQAVSSMPGARVENRVDVGEWCASVERGEHPFHLPACSADHQRDMALWVFPLRWEGLPRSRYERMLEHGALTAEQEATLKEMVTTGLVHRDATGFQLSIVGEVFMGHLVRELKQGPGRRSVDAYIAEGEALARAISEGRAPLTNAANNRQIAARFLRTDP